MSDNYKLKGKAFIDEQGRKHGFVPAVCWFTNLDITKRHAPFFDPESVHARYEGNEDYYPKYDNYDAINVDKTRDIPEDYFEAMGVPITFLDKYNPEEFEILGITCRGYSPELRTKVYTKEEYSNANDLNGSGIIMRNGAPMMTYGRIIIRNKCLQKAEG